MNASTQPAREGLRLVEIINLKWLLSARGRHLHVERLQRDAAYADAVLADAEHSGEPALREAARRLRPRLLPSG